MADRLLLVTYLIGLCAGTIVTVYGFAMLVGAKPGGTPLAMAGLLIGFGTIVASWPRVTQWWKERKRS